LLFLPMDRPLLRLQCALSFPSASCSPSLSLSSNIERDSEGRLLNVHTFVPVNMTSKGTQYVVDGVYAYHHYMQDNFNDNGWGCAYRTLQTICSFLRLNHYSTVAVPSHGDIQKCLVQQNDKPPSFAGSKDWIGAVEVSLFLQQVYNVSSRILFVSDGSEVRNYARQLAMHFKNHATPVMIGGGVLAYGLLGVEVNEIDGSCRFLILDPHYTGSEQIETIIAKGWCGWKGPELFLNNHFYNFCLPQRPNVL